RRASAGAMRFAGGAADPPGPGARPGDARTTTSSNDKTATAVTARPERRAAAEDGEDGEGGVGGDDRFMAATRRSLGRAPSPSYGEPARIPIQLQSTNPPHDRDPALCSLSETLREPPSPLFHPIRA